MKWRQIRNKKATLFRGCACYGPPCNASTNFRHTDTLLLRLGRRLAHTYDSSCTCVSGWVDAERCELGSVALVSADRVHMERAYATGAVGKVFKEL